MLDPNCKDQDTPALIKHIVDEDKLEKILENLQVIRTPVVRSGQTPTYRVGVFLMEGYYNEFIPEVMISESKDRDHFIAEQGG